LRARAVDKTASSARVESPAFRPAGGEKPAPAWPYTRTPTSKPRLLNRGCLSRPRCVWC